MPKRHYCTLFDRNYLLKGVAMLRSIAAHSPGASIHVLCLDESTKGLLDLLAISGVQTYSLSAVETPEVLAVKSGRSVAEYCWTLGSLWTCTVLEANSDIDILTYLDADLLFFSSVEPIFAEIGERSIGAIEHRYTPRLAHLDVRGRFNVQWVSFRRNEAGLACLRAWRGQCLEWCFSRLEEGRFGDQKYLDAWPSTYGAEFVAILNPGAGLAPWNFSRFAIEAHGNRIVVDGQPLIFYHFHQFQLLVDNRFDWMSSMYQQDGPPPAQIYMRYEHALREAVAEVRRLAPSFSDGFRSSSSVGLRRLVQRVLPVPLKNALKRLGLQPW